MRIVNPVEFTEEFRMSQKLRRKSDMTNIELGDVVRLRINGTLRIVVDFVMDFARKRAVCIALNVDKRSIRYESFLPEALELVDLSDKIEYIATVKALKEAIKRNRAGSGSPSEWFVAEAFTDVYGSD